MTLIFGLAFSVSAYSSNCNNAESCWKSGLAEHKRKNYNGAAPHFIRGCNYGKVKSCVAAGDMSKKTRNFKNAEIYFAKSCHLKSALGCNWLGDLYLEMTPAQVNKGLANKSKACNMGNIGACVTGGNMSFEKELYAQAKPLFTKACYNKKDKVAIAAGCNGLGNLTSLLDKQNKSRIVQLYKKGCEVKAPGGFSTPACQNYDFHKGFTPQTLKNAEATCKRTSGATCWQVAQYYLSKEGGGMDLIRGAAYLRLPCNAGDKQACQTWERLTRPTSSGSTATSSTSTSGGYSAPSAPQQTCRTVVYTRYRPGGGGRVQGHKTVCN